MPKIIKLPKDVQAFAEARLKSGHYRSLEDVIRDAFDALKGEESRLDRLRREAAIGFSQLDAGEYVEGTPSKLMAGIRHEHKARP